MTVNKKTIYLNATEYKLENKRVRVGKDDDDGFVIETKTLSNDHTVRALHRVDKDCIVVTGIKVSREAAMCIMDGLHSQLFNEYTRQSARRFDSTEKLCQEAAITYTIKKRGKF